MRRGKEECREMRQIMSIIEQLVAKKQQIKRDILYHEHPEIEQMLEAFGKDPMNYFHTKSEDVKDFFKSQGFLIKVTKRHGYNISVPNSVEK